MRTFLRHSVVCVEWDIKPYTQSLTALTTVTGHFAYETLRLLNSLLTGFHVVYALIQLYNVQQELRDHC